MAKKKNVIDLTISTKYVKSWGWKEGIREIVQNALDAQNVLNKKMTLSYDYDLRELFVCTNGVFLETKTLLFGVSEKGGDNAIGEHGEGYKLAMLSLTRAGKAMTIRTGSELWTPKFRRDPKFGDEPILSIQIEAEATDLNAIEYRICGIVEDEWNEIRQMFLVTQPELRTLDVKTMSYWGDERINAKVILDKTHAGWIYVGGIFVMKNDRFNFGYDLPPKYVELDRDRKSVADYVIENACAYLWQGAFVDAFDNGDEKIMEMIWDHLVRSCSDFIKLKDYSNSRFKERASEYLKKLHKDSYPVSDSKQAARLAKLGIQFVHVSQLICDIVKGGFKEIEELEKQSAEQIIESWTIEDLGSLEHELYTWAWDLVQHAAQRMSLGVKSFVEPKAARFNDEKILGLHVDPGLIYFKRDLLEDSKRQTLLATLLHEWAHFHVKDHGTSMLSVVEDMYELVIAKLIGNKVDVRQEVVAVDGGSGVQAPGAVPDSDGDSGERDIPF